jgi:hypothetical protein
MTTGYSDLVGRLRAHGGNTEMEAAATIGRPWHNLCVMENEVRTANARAREARTVEQPISELVGRLGQRIDWHSEGRRVGHQLPDEDELLHVACN